MNTNYTIDLTLQPTTFDLWHVSLAGAVMLLLILSIVLLLVMVIKLARSDNRPAPAETPKIIQPEPVVQVVEKIVEVEKIVHAPAPEPVILKEPTPDAALQLLSLLQNEARFVDFIAEDITLYNDADVGVAARVVHEGCKKVLDEHFTLAPIRNEHEGTNVTLPQGFDAASVRLTGNIVGHAPFSGTLIHKGWQATHVNLPKLTQSHNANIIAAAEVEL